MIPDQYQRLQDWIWTREPRSARHRTLLTAARYLMALTRDLIEGDISLRAMSLVYTTLLSLVPFLALSFSVLKALGVHDSLAPLLMRMLEPLGDQAAQITQNILGFVDNIKVGVLGFVGVVTLLYTSVSMISKIESSFNFIWKIGQTRGVTQRFSQYLTVLLVGPILIFAALGLTASVRNSDIVTQLASIEPFGTAILLLTKAAPYVLIVAAFTFMYSFIPNTRVKFRAAAIGGLFAGVGWESASAGFATFVAGSQQYSAIYSGFAIVIVLLIWLYVGWLIVLFGCRLAFYVQNPMFLRVTAEPPPPGSREFEIIALSIVEIIGKRFLAGRAPLTADQLPRELVLPPIQIEAGLTALVDAGVVAESGVNRQLFLQRDLASWNLAQLWRAIRGAAPLLRSDDPLTRAREFVESAETKASVAGDISVRDWLESASR